MNIAKLPGYLVIAPFLISLVAFHCGGGSSPWKGCVGPAPAEDVKTFGSTDLEIETNLCAPALADREHCFFVDPKKGKDSNDGSMKAPLKTLGKLIVVNDKAPSIPFDWANGSKTIVLRGGTYDECPSSTGVKSCVDIISIKNLTIKNYPGEKPKIVSPKGENDPISVFNIRAWPGNETENITLDGLEIEGGKTWALKLSDAVKNITVRNCTIHGSGADVVAVKGLPNDPANPYISDCILEHNEIYHGSGAGMAGGMVNDGIDVMAARNMIIRHNVIHDVTGTGLYLKGNARNGLVEKNFVLRSGTGNTLESERDHDSWCGIWLGESVMEGYLPADSPYEVVSSIARNNIVVDCRGSSAFRAVGSSASGFTNNTLYNSEREVRINWAAFSGAGFTQFADNSPDCATYFPENMNRCYNENTTFSNNVIIDNLLQGYESEARPPLVRIWGGADFHLWLNGSTRDNYQSGSNVYYRKDGDYRFYNSDTTDTIDTTNLSEFQSVAGVESGSITATKPILKIQVDPKLEPEDPRSYLVDSNSEAVGLGAGASDNFCTAD
jgi:hypothetical protein